MLTPRVKRFLWLALIVFIVYAVIVSPNEAANVVRTALGKLGSGLNSVGQFVNALMKRS
jgi:cell shape-determining protein MreC